MAIVGWPDDKDVPALLPCMICNAERPIGELSVGLCDANGLQAFACNGHFCFGSQFLVGWALFALKQIALRNNLETFGEGGYGWILR